jgi:hypothetical protein
MTPALRALARRVVARLRADVDGFLRQVRGVIHVGAHTGQERERGWREHARHAFGHHPAGGAHFDVVYRRRPVRV